MNRELVESPSPDPPPRPRPEESSSELMPRVLRALGATLLVVAASSFMFRDWGRGDDVTRYLMLLGQLGLLAGAGFVCGLTLGEKRGARTFLSLVVAVVPVHFAVLGGILYSQLALDAPASHLAAHAVWRAGDPTTAAILIVGAQLLIVPATLVAMMTLARQHARGLTVAFLATCAVLLFPMRGPDVMALVVLGLTPLVLFLQLRVFSGTPATSTPHGRFVRAMFVAPLFILIGRTLLYYEPTALFVGVLLFALGLISFVHDLRADAGRGLDGFAVTQLLAIGSMGLGWMVIWIDSVTAHVALGAGLRLFDAPLLVLPVAAIAGAASHFVARGGLVYRRLAALAAAFTVASNLLAFDGLGAGVLCLAVGLGLGVYGAGVRQKVVIVLGVLAGLAGLVSVGITTIRFEALTHWGSLTALGVASIFGAALLDRNRQRLLRRLSQFRGRVRGWSY